GNTHDPIPCTYLLRPINEHIFSVGGRSRKGKALIAGFCALSAERDGSIPRRASICRGEHHTFAAEPPGCCKIATHAELPKAPIIGCHAFVAVRLIVLDQVFPLLFVDVSRA